MTAAGFPPTKLGFLGRVANVLLFTCWKISPTKKGIWWNKWNTKNIVEHELHENEKGKHLKKQRSDFTKVLLSSDLEETGYFPQVEWWYPDRKSQIPLASWLKHGLQKAWENGLVMRRGCLSFIYSNTHGCVCVCTCDCVCLCGSGNWEECRTREFVWLSCVAGGRFARRALTFHKCRSNLSGCKLHPTGSSTLAWTCFVPTKCILKDWTWWMSHHLPTSDEPPHHRMRSLPQNKQLQMRRNFTWNLQVAMMWDHVFQTLKQVSTVRVNHGKMHLPKRGLNIFHRPGTKQGTYQNPNRRSEVRCSDLIFSWMKVIGSLSPLSSSLRLPSSDHSVQMTAQNPCVFVVVVVVAFACSCSC